MAMKKTMTLNLSGDTAVGPVSPLPTLGGWGMTWLACAMGLAGA